jgi:hypothetical protein
VTRLLIGLNSLKFTDGRRCPTHEITLNLEFVLAIGNTTAIIIALQIMNPRVEDFVIVPDFDFGFDFTAVSDA